jgi:hypothetical protein
MSVRDRPTGDPLLSRRPDCSGGNYKQMVRVPPNNET